MSPKQVIATSQGPTHIGRRLRRWLKRLLPAPLTKAYRRVRDSRAAAEQSSLQQIAVESGWARTGAAKSFLLELDRNLRAKRKDRIAVYATGQWHGLAAVLANAYPMSEVLMVTPSEVKDDRHETNLRYVTVTNREATHAALTGHRPLDILIDASDENAELKITLLRDSFFHLRRRGIYVLVANIRDRSPDRGQGIWNFIAQLVSSQQSSDEEALTPRNDKELSAAIHTLVVGRQILTMRNDARMMCKTNDRTFNRVLSTQPELGVVLETRPGGELRSRCILATNSGHCAPRLPTAFNNPELSLRRYNDPICLPHQVVIKGDVLLPDTFRHFGDAKVVNRFLTDVGLFFALPPEFRSETPQLEGSYFYLDSEWPRHFGHSMTEQLSRTWAWEVAKKRYPDLKVLLPRPTGKPTLADFEVALYSAAGVSVEDIVTVTGPVQVQTLLAATPMFSLPHFVHSDIEEVWRRTSSVLRRGISVTGLPQRIFCSRRSNYKRRCHNAARVEELFSAHGFQIVYPEDEPLGRQAAIFDHAITLAGFAGSAMFNLSFCRTPKRVIIISSESYSARNEHMIASVLGHELNIIYGDADLHHEHGFQPRAAASGFTFNEERDGAWLRQLLEAS